ncbi:hypothetical protein PV08_02337 [Exophiala spinifera]|uniref:Uncharacterized protein n=1 Tax=Exophiala spinifera TaxID=91928 RepID=A0A0D2BHH9_9EURO|nr:uncharacterized protein PV08_02337 [Exophiala spinifera]KIW18050.1 hypothetical protein PV08_02337 [Exophiala spinifera]
MMLTTTLPLFPPPASSLLPAPPSHSSLEPSQQSPHPPNYARRHKSQAAMARNTNLAILSMDERNIVQRKMAIAMYGYSWLKPAGCAKTMLGRREEELEREEVEKQLREVELQERLALEAEEQERLAARDARGETQDDRDLDGDIPDAEEEDDEDDDGEEGWVEDEDSEAMMHTGFDMEGDLDDEVPEADDGEDDDVENENDDDDGDEEAQDQSEPWVYDSRREPDSDEDGQGDSGQLSSARHGRHLHVAGVRVPVPGSEYEYDEQEAEDLANAMLDEDEIFEDEQNMGMEGERDLDDFVPDADEGQWEHTDTEAEESEMDISILPGQLGQSGDRMDLGQPTQMQRSRGGPSRASAASRTSGSSWIASPHTRSRTSNPHRPTPSTRGGFPRETAATGVMSGNRHRGTQAQLQSEYLQTPAMLDSPLDGDVDTRDDDPFASTGPRVHVRPTVRGADAMETASGSGPERRRNGAGDSPSRATAARAWLDGAAAAVGGSARRTLFGRAARRGLTSAAATTVSGAVSLSSGGLFTPSPGVSSLGQVGAELSTPVNQIGGGQDSGQEQAQAQRRSGRFLNSRRRAGQ